MPYNEKLADRVREIISLTESTVTEKKMFGTLCFMVGDKMCVGVEEERLMVRINPELRAEALAKDGCQPMAHSGRVMKGFVFLDLNVVNTNKKLDYWIQLALAYNKIVTPAKSRSKKKTIRIK